jgi:fructuronate reductase
MTRLSLDTLRRTRAHVRTPAYDPATLGCGIVHLGVGAFSRAHQALYTEDAIELAGGAWGVRGVSLRRPDVASALLPQDGLYTLEIRKAAADYRIVGVLREMLVAPSDPGAVLAALAAPETQVVTLTVTEQAYALGPDGHLDLETPDVAHDLQSEETPRSVAGWLAAGLERRFQAGAGPLTILSCDNLKGNGRKLEAAVRTMAHRRRPDIARHLAAMASFPNTVVDAITPASDAALLQRVWTATGLEDLAPVQREPFAQWVIEDAFITPRPAWERAGVQIVPDVAGYQALKLHVLNAAHSTLAYLGLPRGHGLVREAMADPQLAAFLDAMMAEEVAPALPHPKVAAYWRATRARFREPAVDHRLDQIAQDGAEKLRERIHPLIIANARAGRPCGRLRQVIQAWLAREQRPLESALDDPRLFSAPFREDPALRAAMLDAAA